MVNSRVKLCHQCWGVARPFASGARLCPTQGLPATTSCLCACAHEDGLLELRHAAGNTGPNGPEWDDIFSMDVNGSPSPLDLEQTGQKTALSGTEINDIPFPSSHSLRNSMRLMPGVLQDPTGALHFEGAAENQVLYTLNGFNIGNVHVALLRIITVVSAFVLMVLLWLLVNRTRTGKAMRATSYDREAAAMMGIDIDKVIVFTFVLGSALAGAGGVLQSLRVPTTVAIGFVVGLKGFTAAVIGGIGSIPGAMAGGLILGFAESFSQGYISTKWSDLIVFSILIAFMIFRPQGLLGRADIRKV